MFYSTKHGPSKRRNALANPVAKAIAVQQIHQHLRGIQTLAYLLQDGEDAASELAHMAWILGLGCEVAFSLHDDQLARQLHSALRTVHGLALDGYRWKASVAPMVDTQLSVAARLITEQANTAWTMLAGAEWLAHRITTRTTAWGDVAGVEIYAARPAAEIGALAPATQGGGGATVEDRGGDDQQAPAGPVGDRAGTCLAAGTGEVMDEGLARRASPAVASQVAAC